MNIYFWKVQQKSVEIVQNQWVLHQKPPFVHVFGSDGNEYRANSKGQTFLMSGPNVVGEVACPFPALFIELEIRAFMFKHRSKAPAFLTAIAALIVAFYGASAWLIIEHPAAGEMLQNALWTALLWTVSICATLAAVRMFIGFRNSAKYVYESELARVQETKELDAGPAPEIDLGEDILVMQKEGETGADFETRLAGVRMNLQPGEWAVAFCFRHPTGTIWASPTATTLFQRNQPPFQNENWTEEQLIVPANAVFHREEYPDFRWYCETFAHYYKGWAPAYKIESADKGDAANTWLDTVKLKSAAVLLCLLFAVGLSAQSAKAVQQATNGLKPPAQGTEVSYVFAKKTMGRIGNGKLNYTDLLKSIPTYRDCCHGALIAIYNGETVVAKGPAAETVSDGPQTKAAAMRPVSAIPPSEVAPGGGWQMPDSLTVDNSLRNVEEGFDFYKSKMWEMLRPVWKTIMYIFFGILPLFIGIGGIAKYIGGTARGENFYGLSYVGRWIMGVHEAASGVSLIISWLVCGTLLIEEFMFLVYFEQSLWWLLIIWIPSLWIAQKLTNWWVVNPPMGGNDSSDHRSIYTPTSRQLR